MKERSRSKRRGRQARTVAVSLLPAHLAWMDQMRAKAALGRSKYIQRLVEADRRTGGEVLARAILADYEELQG